MKLLNIEEYIPIGKENAVTRDRLMSMTGLSDRKNRELIEQARKNGAIILNDQDGRGYYKDESPKALKKQYFQNKNRAMSILVQQKYIRRKLKEYGESV